MSPPDYAAPPGGSPMPQAAKGSIRRRSHGTLHATTLRPDDREDKIKQASRRLIPVLYGAAVFTSILLISTFLFQPYIAAFFRRPIWRASQDGESLPYQSLDHPLHPDEHVHRSPQTLYHEWQISSGLRRPDGVLKEVYLINDDFLGPTIECRSGDRLVITVHNDLQDDGIAMHWHGLHMRGANGMDGAAGFTQDPIPPGGNFTYDFSVAEDQHGTFWYHAHDGVQRADGLFGALIVHRPAETGDETDQQKYAYDEERLLMIGDWYHRSAKDVMDWYMRAASFGNEPVPDSMLLNGVGAYSCAKAVPARPVNCTEVTPPSLAMDAQKRYRLRMINVGNLGGFTMAGPGLKMTVIQVDGGHEVAGIVPTTSVGVLHPGQRADVVMEVDSCNAGRTELVLELDRTNFKYPNPALTGKQAFEVLLAGEVSISPSIAKTEILDHFDLDMAQPSIDSGSDILSKADLTMVLYSTSVKLAHLSNKPHGFLNQTSWKLQATPPGHLLGLSRDDWDEHQFVPQIPLLKGDAGLWVDIVLNNLDDGSHPFHLHGYDFWVLQTHKGFGWGSWNPFEAAEAPGGPLNTRNPVKRDTVFVPKRGYTVLRLKADNPGIWMFHCHILWHQASGMAMGLQVGEHSPVI